MNIEYEATFANINKDEIRERLKGVDAVCERSEYLQKRIPFHLPKEKRSDNAWLRVRDEGGNVTLSLKVIDGDKIENQKELLLHVDNFNTAVQLLEAIGCESKSYQETNRELWKLNDTEITIDEWPFLEPFVEIEGNSEKAVRRVAEKLGFDWDNALFCAVGKLYEMKYGIPEKEINLAKKIVFGMENPFVKK